MSEQLLPCPFCGGKAVCTNGWNEDGLFAAVCGSCGTIGPFALQNDIAVSAWNRRVPAPPQGVPVGAIRTLREYGIPLGMTYAKWHKACQEVQRWLDAQPQTGQDAL